MACYSSTTGVIQIDHPIKKLVMKKVLLIAVGAAMIFAACNSNPKTSAENEAKINYADTAGLAAFQQWKIQHELENTAALNQEVASQAAPKQVVYRTVYRDRPAASRSTSSGSYPSQTPAPAKKGISKAAKGAAIGTVGGAVIGAVINKKNRTVGGVVGGVIGGVVGYGIGRGMDKKDGRYLTSTPDLQQVVNNFQ